MEKSKEVTVTTLGAASMCLSAFSLGALLSGAVNYSRSTKMLQLEGIDPQLRLRAIPLALKAFGTSTAVMTGIGLCGWIALNHYGISFKSDTSVSTFDLAIEEIKRQQAHFIDVFRTQVEQLKANKAAKS